jgi:hypothetical protein
MPSLYVIIFMDLGTKADAAWRLVGDAYRNLRGGAHPITSMSAAAFVAG